MVMLKTIAYWYVIPLVLSFHISSSYRIGVINSHDDISNAQCRAAIMLAIEDLFYHDISLSLQPVFMTTAPNRLIDTTKLASVDVALSSVADSLTALPDVLSALALPYIEYQAKKSSYSNRERYPHFLRISSSAAIQGEVLAEVLSTGYQWRRVVVLASQDSYWQYLVTSFQHSARACAMDVDVYYPLSQTSLRKSLRDIQSTWRHIYLLLMSPEDAAAVLLEGRDIGIFHVGTQIVGPAEISNDQFANSIFQGGLDPVSLSGYIGIVDAVSAVGNAGADFIARWRSQAPTRIDHNDGTVWCSNATDDDGQFIYYDPASPQNCSGLDFRLFSADGSDIHPSAILAYDATISLALAINHTLTHSLSVSPANIFETITTTVRTGVSGLIAFNSSNSFLDLGDRSAGLLYNLVNFQAHVSNGTFVKIGAWSSELGFEFCVADEHNCAIAWYNNKDPSQPPLDARVVMRQMESLYRSTLFISSIICGGIIFCIYLFIVSHNQSILVKVSQPWLSFVVLLGGLVGCGLVWSSSRDVSDASCMMQLWFSHISIFAVIITLVLKAWRVHTVVEGRDEKIKIATQTVLINIFIAVCVPCILLALISGMYPPKASVVVADRRYGVPIYDMTCTNADMLSTPLHVFLYILQCLIIVAGMWYAYITRHIPDGVGDAIKVGQGNYFFDHFAVLCAVVVSSIVIITLVGIAVLYTIEFTPSTHRFIIAIMFLIAIFRVLYLLFADMVFNLIRGYDLNANFSLAKLANSNLFDSFFGRLIRSARVSDISPSSSDSSRIKKAYSADELEKEVAKCKRKLTKYRLQLQLVQEAAIKRNFDMLSHQASWSRSSSRMLHAPTIRHTATSHADSFAAIDDRVIPFHSPRDIADNVA